MADTIQWIATCTGIIAAITVAGNFGAKITGWGFLIFVVSSVGWVAFAVMKGETPLAIQNIVLFAVNLFGIWRYWIVKAKKAEA
jgi:hypothetical protein